MFLGLFALGAVGVLFLWDAFPERFPARSHNFLGAFPLAMIACAYLLYQSARRPAFREWVKAIMLAAAFFFWAANQLWPDLRQAVLLNDIAIGLFVLDVLLVIMGWPAASADESFGETQPSEEEKL
ncbi:MAG: hypothetical protein ABSE42_12990 [Bryobacteraceae bacterium]|jgi:hypothetical protein